MYPAQHFENQCGNERTGHLSVHPQAVLEQFHRPYQAALLQRRGLCPTTQQTGKYFATGLGDGKQLLITLDAGMDKWVPFV